MPIHSEVAKTDNPCEKGEKRSFDPRPVTTFLNTSRDPAKKRLKSTFGTPLYHTWLVIAPE